MNQPSLSDQCKIVITCLLKDKQKLVDILMQESDQFDLWHAQRYGVVASKLTVPERVKGYIDICVATLMLSYNDASALKYTLHHKMPDIESVIVPLLATH